MFEVANSPFKNTTYTNPQVKINAKVNLLNAGFNPAIIYAAWAPAAVLIVKNAPANIERSA